jgi:hypothetical protein
LTPRPPATRAHRAGNEKYQVIFGVLALVNAYATAKEARKIKNAPPEPDSDDEGRSMPIYAPCMLLTSRARTDEEEEAPPVKEVVSSRGKRGKHDKPKQIASAPTKSNAALLDGLKGKAKGKTE